MSATKSEFFQSSTTSSTLKGGVLPDESNNVSGSGDCFFKSVSHQLYGTAHLSFEILMSGIAHLNNHPEFFMSKASLTTLGQIMSSKCQTQEHGNMES